MPLSPEVSLLRQADVITISSLPVKWDHPGDVQCRDGVVVISQTCDLIRDNRAEVQVVPLVRLPTQDASQARSGRQPRYAAVSSLGPEYFADLSIVATVHKKYIVEEFRQHGVDQTSHNDISNFGQAVGRRFDRYAFPDDVTPWLKPLQDILRSRAPKENSPLYRPIQKIVELRLEAVNGWTAEPPFDLVLMVVVEAGVLPELDEDLLGSVDLTGPDVEKLVDIANQMPPDGADPIDITVFWERFGNALARQCTPPKGAPAAVVDAVRSFSAEVVSEDDLQYSRVRRSAEIDLDHLSDAGPA